MNAKLYPSSCESQCMCVACYFYIATVVTKMSKMTLNII
jgi:ferredoxin